MSKMRETGIPWLPEISVDFSVGYVKQYFYISKVLSNEGEPERVLKLARAGIVEKDVTTNEGQMAASYEGYNKVQVGDLLLNPMDLYSGANCNVSELTGVISPAYSNLRAKKIGTVVPKFYDYYFKSQYWLMAMFAHGKGVSFDNRWTLNNDSLRSYEIPITSYSMQECIVERIQSEVKKVDELITNVQAQIEKLKLYKQSLIAEIVSKGLNKIAPMKDSGIEWIGKIPAHWEIAKLRTRTHMLTPMRDKPEDLGGPIPWIRIEDYCGKYITASKEKLGVSMDTVVAMNLKIYPVGTVLCTSSCDLGKCAIVRTELVSNQRFIGIIPQPHLSSDFLYYLMLSNAERLNTLSTGSIQANLSRVSFEQLLVQFPPYEEQVEIAQYLDTKCEAADQLIAIKQKKIEKLEQYKKSLIYEYVTGKKEVS